MNPLPRLLALGLLVILATLAAMLAAPAVRSPRVVPPASAESMTGLPPAPAPALRVVEFAHRVTFPLALTGFVLAIALVASLAVRPPRVADPALSPASSRAEMGALAKLAASSAAQGQELAHERDIRQRAESDSLLHQQLLNRSLEEKIRLGHDLHDGIIQSLYAAGLTIESARSVAQTDPADADRRLSECRENLNRTIRDVRAYIAGLAPENLRQTGFEQALNALLQELGADRDVEFELRIDEAATAQLTSAQETETLQVAREAVSNSLRHGSATHVTVRLHPGDGEACLLVQDNGHGFDPASRRGSGHGLRNMEARAKRVGGHLRIDSLPGSGTRVVLTLPVRRA